MSSTINASTASGGGVITTADASGILQLQTAGVTGLTIDASQNVTLAKGLTVGASAAPAFSAYQSSAQTLTSNVTTKILFQTEEFDTNSNFASSTFTPTVAGYYQVSAAFAMGAVASGGNIAVYKNGGLYKYMYNIAGFAVNLLAGTCLVNCNGTTDYIEIYGTLGTGQVTSANATATYFQAAMIRSA